MDTNYFDNISETDKSFTHVPISDQLATSLEDNNSSDEEDSSKWKTDSESLIDENIEHENEREILQTECENEREILQIENNNLKPCAVIDYIDNTDTVEQAEGQLENLTCISQRSCPALQKFDSILIQSQSFVNSRYICCKCYEKFGGHFYQHLETGRKFIDCIKEGKHDQDITNSLLLFSTWIKQVAYSNNINLKTKTLSLITPTLQILKKDQFNFNFQNPPINILLREKKQIISQKLQLEEPKSLLEFYKALPFQLIQFFKGLIQTFLEKLNNNANQKQ
ncbi:hypothetical protein Glove_281g65 [Diversispora epigaea]|uniref:Uncharacterized protein n=1 Tax=Diversispora epigaea TaxID=1348612 RepID=A0A397I204_9GLOM|nr:hypothetical protein Glove_281g65 [Diversispora epigaea]